MISSFVVIVIVAFPVGYGADVADVYSQETDQISAASRVVCPGVGIMRVSALKACRIAWETRMSENEQCDRSQMQGHGCQVQGYRQGIYCAGRLGLEPSGEGRPQREGIRA